MAIVRRMLSRSGRCAATASVTAMASATTPASASSSLVIEAWPAAQTFGAPLSRLTLETPLVLCARHARGLAGLGHDQCAPHQLRQALFGLAAVVLLCAVIARDDQQCALCGQAP